MDTHFDSELIRAEKLSINAERTRKAHEALQFPRKPQAVVFARSIGWEASSAERVKVLGFYVWALRSGSFQYLTARGALRLLNDQAKYPSLARNVERVASQLV